MEEQHVNNVTKTQILSCWNQTRLWNLCTKKSRPTSAPLLLSASLIKMQISIKEEGRRGGDRIGLEDSLGATSCLMFGCMNRDQSYTADIWDVEVGEGREQGS